MGGVYQPCTYHRWTGNPLVTRSIFAKCMLYICLQCSFVLYCMPTCAIFAKWGREPTTPPHPCGDDWLKRNSRRYSTLLRCSDKVFKASVECGDPSSSSSSASSEEQLTRRTLPLKLRSIRSDHSQTAAVGQRRTSHWGSCNVQRTQEHPVGHRNTPYFVTCSIFSTYHTPRISGLP